MLVFQVQVGGKGQEFSGWKADQLRLCESINAAFLKRDAASASEAFKALAGNIKQKYGKDYELPQLKKLGDKIDGLKQNWVPPIPQWFALKTAIGKLEEPMPAVEAKKSEFVQDSTKTKTPPVAAPKEQGPKPNTTEWLGLQSDISGTLSLRLINYADLPAGKTLSNAGWNELKADAQDLSENLNQLDVSRLDKAGQDKAATLVKYASALSDQLNKWKNLTKEQAGGYAKNMDEIYELLQSLAGEPEEAPVPVKKAEKLQQKVKVIPLDIVPGAREHMMSLNEDSKSGFRAKGLKMDTAGANQKFNYAISLAASYAGLDVTTTVGKGNRLLLSKEGESRLASLSDRERAALFLIADMVAIRGEGNTKALLEKLTGGTKWGTDEFLAAAWHEGESLIVKEMGLKDKASARFWSDRFKGAASGFAAEEPKEKPEAKKQEAAVQEEEKAARDELRKLEVKPLKFEAAPSKILPKELKHVEVPVKPEPAAREKGRVAARTEAKSFDAALIEGIIASVGLEGKYLVEQKGGRFQIKSADSGETLWSETIPEGFKSSSEKAGSSSGYLALERGDSRYRYLFENKGGKLSVTYEEEGKKQQPAEKEAARQQVPKPEVVVKVGEEEEGAAAVVPVTGTWVDRFSGDREIQEYCDKLSAEQKSKAAEWIKNNIGRQTLIDQDRIGALAMWVYAVERAK